MSSVRIIPRLDIKAPNLIKGIHLEGLRVLGDPQTFANQYFIENADELIYMDIVASLYGRNSLIDLVSHTAKNIFIPLTVGGGIRSVDDVRALLRAGADKIAINTAAVQNPQLIHDISRAFGSQCVVLSIEAKKVGHQRWEAFTDNGREHTHLDVLDWVKKGISLGAGEILLTSVDQEGTRKGFDTELVKAVTDISSIPVIASGGMGTLEHFSDVCLQSGANAVAIADALHYKRLSLSQIRAWAKLQGIPVRQLEESVYE